MNGATGADLPRSLGGQTERSCGQHRRGPSATKSFNGTVLCAKAVGNAATIVAVDSSTNRSNRTMVQDNGAGGDKLVNTASDLGKLSPRARDRALACIDPAVAKLDAAPALAGDAIQVN